MTETQQNPVRCGHADVDERSNRLGNGNKPDPTYVLPVSSNSVIAVCIQHDCTKQTKHKRFTSRISANLTQRQGGERRKNNVLTVFDDFKVFRVCYC